MSRAEHIETTTVTSFEEFQQAVHDGKTDITIELANEFYMKKWERHTELNAEFIKIMREGLKGNTTVTSFAIVGLEPDQRDELNELGKALLDNKTLKKLDFSSSRICSNSATIANILNYTAIEELDFNNNQIGDLGVRHLGEILKENTHLKILNLSGNNHISSYGIGLLDCATKSCVSLKFFITLTPQTSPQKFG